MPWCDVRIVAGTHCTHGWSQRFGANQTTLHNSAAATCSPQLQNRESFQLCVFISFTFHAFPLDDFGIFMNHSNHSNRPIQLIVSFETSNYLDVKCKMFKQRNKNKKRTRKFYFYATSFYCHTIRFSENRIIRQKLSGRIKKSKLKNCIPQ